MGTSLQSGLQWAETAALISRVKKKKKCNKKREKVKTENDQFMRGFRGEICDKIRLKSFLSAILFLLDVWMFGL